MQVKKYTVAAARRPEAVGQEALLQGWVRTRRDSKAGFSFIELNDGSCFGNIQIVADSSLPNYESDVKRLSPGSSIAARGLIRESPGKGQATELQAQSLTVLGIADPDSYPLQKKRHSFEFLRTIAHLRPRTNTFGAIARVRNCLCQVDPPVFPGGRVPLYPHADHHRQRLRRGGRDVPGHDAESDRRAAAGRDASTSRAISSSVPAYLTVSGQLEAEIFACGLGKVYTFGPTFRAENSNTSRHLAEFWMIEPEMAFFELTDNMELAERFLKSVLPRRARSTAREDMEFFNERIDTTLLATLQSVLASDFVRLSYTEAVEMLLASGEAFEFPVAWGIDLQSEHERYLTEKNFSGP